MVEEALSLLINPEHISEIPLNAIEQQIPI